MDPFLGRLYKSDVTAWRITDLCHRQFYDRVTYFLRIKTLRTLEKLAIRNYQILAIKTSPTVPYIVGLLLRQL